MQFVEPVGFEEALRKLGERTAVGSGLTASEWRDVPAALRERAFFSSRVESIRFLQRAREAIGDWLASSRERLESGEEALKAGSRAVFVEQMRRFALSEGMGPLEPEDAGTVRDITSERRLGLIFEVQTQQAADYGWWRQGQQPEVLNEWPAMRFVRVKEVAQERDAHRPHEGRVYLKNDPVWERVINQDFGVPWGPWGWGCGHDVEEVDREEAEALGLVKRDEVLAPAERWFNENLRASVKGLDEDLVGRLAAEFGDRVEVGGEALRWRGEALGRELALGQGPLRQHPVGEAVRVETHGRAKEQALVALGAIEKVHDLPAGVPQVPLQELGGRVYGRFACVARPAGGYRAQALAVRSGGPWPSLTAAHEIGHWLDLEVFGEEGGFGTESAMMAGVLGALEATAAVRALRLRRATTTSPAIRQHLDYLLHPREMWARAYAQYIAERSKYRVLSEELERARAAEQHRQWATEDFEPVGRAIDVLMKAKGLR